MLFFWIGNWVVGFVWSAVDAALCEKKENSLPWWQASGMRGLLVKMVEAGGEFVLYHQHYLKALFLCANEFRLLGRMYLFIESDVPIMYQ